MPDTEELRQMESAECADLLVVGGVGAWTNVPELAAQADYFGDGRPLWVGLTPPRYELGIDPLDARHEDFRTRFEIQDQRDTAGGSYLAALFRAWHESEEPLGLTVEAGDTATADATLFGRHVGTERIGPAGERAYWSFMPGWGIGDQHLGLDYENADLPAATVSDVPVVFRGRRVSLWRVYRDRVTYPDDRTQGWRPWSESVRRWWGELEDGGTVDGSRWSIDCRGPDAFMGRQLGTLSQDEPVPVQGLIRLSDAESRMGVLFRSVYALDANINEEEYGSSLDFTEQLALAYDYTTDVISAVASFVATYAGAAGPGPSPSFNASHGQSVRLDEDGIGIRIDNNQAAPRSSVMTLCLHRKVWRALGFDPDLQDLYANNSGLADDAVPVAQDHDGLGAGFPAISGFEETATPGPGFYSLTFSTGAFAAFTGESAGAWDNNGNERFFPALYPGGVANLPADLGEGITITVLPSGGGIVRHTGQLDRPPTEIPAGGGGVRVQGVWLLEGPRSTQLGEVEDEVQVVVCSWIEGNFPGSVGAGVDAELVITRWLDPRRFGIDRDSIPESGYDWAILQNDPENRVTARPVFRLGYSEHGFDDRAEEEILRLMLTTGASGGWTGFEGDPAATLDTTSNEPAGTGVFDAEIRDLGLAIPEDLVAPVAQWRSEFAKLPPGPYRDLACLVRPGQSAAELIEGWMRFYGLMPSLHGGRYGVVTLLDRFEPEDVQVVLTQASKAPRERTVARTTQTLRVFRPVDTFVVSYRYDVAQDKFTREERIRANDRGVRYRSDGQECEMQPKGIRTPTGWRSRRTQIARFWERRHFLITGWPVLSRLVGENVWPGSIVRLTEPRGVSQSGTYGIDGQIGIVLKKREDAVSKMVELDILVQADASRPFAVMAPSALGYGIDTDTNEILVRDDWAGIGNGWSDASRFIEPDWSDAGGQLDVKGLQWDGQTMTETWTGTVSAVTTTPGASRIQLTAPPTGTYYRDMPCWVVPREYANQSAAWALQYLAVIGDDAGEHGAGLRSSRWSD